MNLTPEEADRAIKDAAVAKIRLRIGGHNNPDCVNIDALAEFLYEEFKPKITISDLPKKK